MNSVKWGICPVCEQRCTNGATIHYNCWRASFGWDSDELRQQIRKYNAIPMPKAAREKLPPEGEWK